MSFVPQQLDLRKGTPNASGANRKLYVHPTRGEMTYELTDEGLAFCREVARQPA
jgi:hypothetical protein